MEDPPRTSKRIRKSCERCRARKQRCSGFPVCSNCLSSKEECKQPASALEEYRSGPNQALLERIAFLEAQLALKNNTSTIQETPQGRDYDALRDGPISPATSQSDDGSTRDSIADVVGFLSLGGERAYVGASSGFGLASSLGQMAHATIWNKAISATVKEHQSKSASLNEIKRNSANPPTDAMGSRILHAYFERVHHRYPFLDRSDILEQHDMRFLQQTPATPAQQFAKFKLYMIYAIGATLLQLTEPYDYVNPEAFFMTALQYVSAAREHNAVSAIEAMALLVIYNLRSPSNSGIFFMIGLGMRSCVDLGLHREAHYKMLSPYTAQVRRRLFWTIYFLERVIAVSLGRPYSIADRDIDARLPIDISDDITDDATIERQELVLENLNVGGQRRSITNLTLGLQCIQLMRIESYIQTTIYRVDVEPVTLLNRLPTILRKLEDYRETIPTLTGYEADYLDMTYWKSVRLAIQPFLNILQRHDSRIALCLKASGQICQILKRLHQRDSYGHSFIALHSVFIAGVTMCYCLFLSPKLWNYGVAEDLRSCSSALFVMAERTPSVVKYRDALESVISSTMEFMSRNRKCNVQSPKRPRRSDTHTRKRSRHDFEFEQDATTSENTKTDARTTWNTLFDSMSAAAPWQRDSFIADPFSNDSMNEPEIAENVSHTWSSSGFTNVPLSSINEDFLNEDYALYDPALFQHHPLDDTTLNAGISIGNDDHAGGRGATRSNEDRQESNDESIMSQGENEEYMHSGNVGLEMPLLDAKWLASICEGDGFSIQALNEMMKVDGLNEGGVFDV